MDPGSDVTMPTVHAALRPLRLEVSPSGSDATQVFKHWAFVLDCCRSSLPATHSPQQALGLLAASLSHVNYSLIAGCETYEAAMVRLKSYFIRTPNEVVARHQLLTRKQQPSESTEDFVRSLHLLARDCDYRDCTAQENLEACVRDAFIAGISSSNIRTRLLENRILSLADAQNQARALELAQIDSRLYSTSEDSPSSIAVTRISASAPPRPVRNTSSCRYCGCSSHPRSKCPARNSSCRSCQKRGHFSRVCLSTPLSAHVTEDCSDYSPEAESSTEIAAALSPRL